MEAEDQSREQLVQSLMAQITLLCAEHRTEHREQMPTARIHAAGALGVPISPLDDLTHTYDQ